MPGVMVRIPATRLSADDILEFPGGASSLSDMVLGFIEEATYAFPENNTSGSDEEENSCTTTEENKAFWEEQHQLLQVIKLIHQQLVDYFHFDQLLICTYAF